MIITYVSAAQCPKCKEWIYPRCSRDFHYCSCGETAIDGSGKSPDIISIHSNDLANVKIKRIKISASREDLYNDWNKSEDKYGRIYIIDE